MPDCSIRFFQKRAINVEQKTRWLAPIFLALCVNGPAFAGNVIFDINYIDETEQTNPSVASYSVNQHVVGPCTTATK
jgi:hypothetical protein